MSIPGAGSPLFLSAAAAPVAAHQIDRSVLFDDDDTANLSRTPSSASNRKTWTWSAWVKRSAIGIEANLFTVGSSSTNAAFRFNANDTLQVRDGGGGELQTNAVFRDPGAWMHIVVSLDNTQSTNTDRFKLYVNGVEQTYSSASYASQNTDGDFNTTDPHYIGRQAHNTAHTFDGYLAEIHFVDGVSGLTASDFGSYDSNNVWQPKDCKDDLTYGTNGFYLKFADNSSDAALGTDSSGQNNSWTVNNITAVHSTGTEVTAAWAGYVGSWSTSDTWNSLGNASNNFGNNGGTKGYSTTTETWAGAKSISVGDFGSSNRGANGWALRYPASTTITIDPGAQSYLTDLVVCANESTAISAGTSVTSFPATVTGQVFWLRYTGNGYPAVDAFGSVTNPAAAVTDSVLDTPTNYTPDSGNAGGSYCTWNPLDVKSTIAVSNGNLDLVGSTDGRTRGTLGMPSGKFYWEITVGSAAGNHIGIWATNIALTNDSYRVIYLNGGVTVIGGSVSTTFNSYTDGDVIGIAFDAATRQAQFFKNGTSEGTLTAPELPAGSVYTPACIMADTNSSNSANFGQRQFLYTPPSNYLPLVSTNLSQPTIGDGSKAMDVVTFSGDGTNGRNITGLSFSPDLVWIKARNQTDGHNLFDIVRGTTKVIKSNNGNAELTESNSLTAFNSDGFTVGSNSSNAQVNASGFTYVGWCWDAGSSTSSNSDGSITTNVRASQANGFSIIGYTGNATAGATIGHGLNSDPEWLVFKNRDDTLNWYVYHKAAGHTKYFTLDRDHAATTHDFLNNTAPTNSVITLNNTAEVNATGQDIICYAWTSVSGFSSFGSFVGTGSSSTAPFVFTGMRPALVIVKASSGTGPWNIYDSARAPYNVVQAGLLANEANAEFTGTDRIDFLSNGFRVKAGSAVPNESGVTYIYMSWAEHPLATSRAR